MRLIIEDITKRYGTNIALDNFTATLTEGVYGLIGPNGAGKTTLINILVGLIKADSGRVMFWEDAEKVKEYSKCIPVEKLGFLPQSPGFYKNFTAREFLLYMGALKNCSKKSLKKYVDELLESVNLYEVRNKKIGSFSGGMKQRLGIAQAIINDPKIVILDEPTAGLDPRERIRFRNIISSLSTDKIVILATHIVSDIAFIAKEVLLLKKGQLVKKGAQEILAKEIEGKVWEIETDGKNIISYMNNYKVSNVANTQNGYCIRIVDDRKPEQEAVMVQATLEDVCLYYFGEV
ncbi:ABC transporter, ATP-binding protein [Proteiniborus sp. DW1]|uniref:ABC transporter ATP-binding protein n=1 Tax=Proteiniborus sp. DW1 TaxID=1889883 RepID=UPI00092DF1D9|nr:ABC transporter ATP-binding protein [Proteiniborus sp. DW1]SCG82400.1 ABC transporter, ATP-binding protein [Proteiniborus sp. DW1]